MNNRIRNDPHALRVLRVFDDRGYTLDEIEDAWKRLDEYEARMKDIIDEIEAREGDNA